MHDKQRLHQDPFSIGLLLLLIAWSVVGKSMFCCRVRNAGELQIDAVAATIAQLSKVRRRRTMVVLLDRGDGTAVPIAKRLLTFGVLNSCVVQGGFRYDCLSASDTVGGPLVAVCPWPNYGS